MLPEMTPAVSRALESGQARALARQAGELACLDVLAGLLEEQEGQAATLAMKCGLDLGAFLASLPALLKGEGLGQPLPLARSLHEALRQARNVARMLSGEATVDGEALLLALVEIDKESADDLTAHGLEISRLEAHLEQHQPASISLDDALALSDVTERVNVGRVLDACANRAREALRVIEDYTRFVLGDAFLSAQLKQLRHDLVATLAEWGPEELIQARETLRDVGTQISSPDEHHRANLTEVLQANLKRLQEALRSLEEFGKVRSAFLARSLEQLRYRSYTLERTLLVGVSARQRLRHARLQVLLSGESCLASVEWTLAEAVGGGADIIQLREKNLTDRHLLDRAKQVRRWTREAGVLFILNDRPDIARLVEADGVHLGQDDLPVMEARRILGPDALIGVSTHNLDQVHQAILDGASYLGAGPLFPSQTKTFTEFPGLSFLQQALAETTLPVFAIGGINLDTINMAVTAGARRVAVSQAIARAEEPRLVAGQIVQALGGL